MRLDAFSTNIPAIQPQFNPIQNYNQYLKGSASFEINDNFQNDFERMLQREMSPEPISASRKFDNMSPVDSLMHSIENAFGNGLNDVNMLKKQSNELQEAFARGEDVSVHDLMIASEKSSLSMQMAMQIRNKMISAYTDIKNMSF